MTKPKLQKSIAFPISEYNELVRMMDDMGYKKKRGPASLLGVGVMHVARKQYRLWEKQQARKEKANDV